jgi:hypothetical protein
MPKVDKKKNKIYYENQVDLSEKAGFCFMMSINNALGQPILSKQHVNESLKHYKELHTNHKWRTQVQGSQRYGGYATKVVIRAAMLKGVSIERIKGLNLRKIAKFVRGTFVVIGTPAGPPCSWNHAVALSEGQILDPDRRKPLPLSLENLKLILQNTVYFYRVSFPASSTPAPLSPMSSNITTISTTSTTLHQQ